MAKATHDPTTPAPRRGAKGDKSDFLRQTAPAVAAAHPDAALLAACAKMRQAKRAIDALPRPVADSDIDRLDGDVICAMQEITALPAVTEAGVRAKAAAAHTALMSQVNTFKGMDWREEANAMETLALVTLHEIAGRAA